MGRMVDDSEAPGSVINPRYVCEAAAWYKLTLIHLVDSISSHSSFIDDSTLLPASPLP